MLEPEGEDREESQKPNKGDGTEEQFPVEEVKPPGQDSAEKIS